MIKMMIRVHELMSHVISRHGVTCNRAMGSHLQAQIEMKLRIMDAVSSPAVSFASCEADALSARDDAMALEFTIEWRPCTPFTSIY